MIDACPLIPIFIATASGLGASHRLPPPYRTESCNDDAIRAVKLIVSKMADAVIEANQGQTDAEGEIQAESEEFATEE